MPILTPEDLERLQSVMALIKPQQQLNVAGMNVQPPAMQDVSLARGAAPAQQPDVTPPPNPATQPYLQAEQLQREVQPRPTGPQNWKEGIVQGIQGAMSPGGVAAMQYRNQQTERQRQQDVLGRVKELRQEGIQNQQLYNQDQNQQLDREQQNRAFGLQQDNADLNRMNVVSEIKARERTPQHVLNPGDVLAEGPNIIAHGEDKAAPTPPVEQQELTDWLAKNKGKGPADFAAYKATLGQRPQRQVLWGDDPNDPTKQRPYEYDETTRTVRPIDVSRTPTQQLNTNAKVDQQGESASKSVAALEGLAKQNTYIADVAMADQFFNVIKPDSGARMNQSYIDKLMTAGPLKNKMAAWAQKLNQGQLLTAEDRQYMIEAARVVAETKAGGTKPPATGGGAGGKHLYFDAQGNPTSGPK